MKLTRDLKELIKRKLKLVQDRKEKDVRDTIQKALNPFEDKDTALNKEIGENKKAAKKKAKSLGASDISLYSNSESYIYLIKRHEFDVDEEYYKILEEIEIGEDSTLKEIFERIDRM